MRAAMAVLILALAAVGPAFANPVSADPAKAPAGTYELDKRHASLLVRVAHLGGFSRYTFRMTGVSGGFVLDPANWQAAKATISVDPKSVDTGEASFDKEISGWFEPAKYPAIIFASTAAAGEGGRGTVSGDLTLHGVTRPVTLDVVFNGSGPGLLGAGTRMGFSGSTKIKRSDFGLTQAKSFAADEVELVFEVEFVKK